MCKIIIYSHFNNIGTLNTMFCHYQDVMWSFSGSYFDFVRLLKKIHLKFDPNQTVINMQEGIPPQSDLTNINLNLNLI